jgi:YVTN family beta-propeller protein
MLNNQKQQQQEWTPYVGPRPFKRDPEEQKLFFGRKYESEKIISLIYSHKLVLVYAQSGAGKTSIFNANIVPALEQKGFQVLPLARVIGSPNTSDASSESTYYVHNDIDRSSETNPYIFNAFQRLASDIHDRTLLRAKSFSTFMHDYFPHKVNQRGKPMPQVIIFDQLEEIFSLYSDPNRWHEQQQDFFRQIAYALENDLLLRVVFIIREDYLAQLDPFAWLLPEKLKPRFRLERLQKDAALEAVKGPLETAKSYVDERLIKKLFDEDIIDKLIEDLLKIRVETTGGQSREIKGEFVEPIQLQIVCQRLWNKLKVSQIGQINQEYFGYLGDVDKALQDFYVEAIREAVKQNSISENVIRNWFEEKLITSSGTRGIVHRGIESTGGISNRIVNILEKKYIIRKEERSGAQWYELTHDRLIGPIKDSNRAWKYEREKKARKIRTVKLIIPVIAAAIVGTMLLTNYYSSHPQIIVISHYPILPSSSSLSVGRIPFMTTANPITNVVYVTNRGNGTVSVIDGKTNTVTGNINVGNSPTGISVNPNTNMVYVANVLDGTVSVIDGKTNTVTGNITVGFSPSGISVNPNTNVVYVTNYGDGTVSVIDGKTNTVAETIPAGKAPNDISLNPNNTIIYVTNSADNNVSYTNTAVR